MGSSPLRPAEQGLTQAVSHFPALPILLALPSALRMHPVAPGTTQTEQPAVFWGKWVPGGRGRAQTMWCPQL